MAFESVSCLKCLLKEVERKAKCLAVGWLNYYVSLSSGNSSAVDSSSQSDGNSSSSSPTKVSAASPNFKAYKKNAAVNKLSILGMRFSPFIHWLIPCCRSSVTGWRLSDCNGVCRAYNLRGFPSGRVKSSINMCQDGYPAPSPCITPRTVMISHPWHLKISWPLTHLSAIDPGP